MIESGNGGHRQSHRPGKAVAAGIGGFGRALAALAAGFAPTGGAVADSGLQEAAVKLFAGRADHWLCLESCAPPLTVARFGFDRSQLGQGDLVALREVAAAINDERMKPYEQSYEVSCYTDPIGTVAYNAALSRERARAVEAALMAANPGRPVVFFGKGVHPEPARAAAQARVCVIEVAHTRGRFRN